MIQLHGRKKVLLISPEFIEKVYLYEQGHIHDRQSRINCVHDPVLNLFPDFDDVPAFQGTIEAGDMVYIPHGWLHQVP